jgi:protein subunit release factor A
MHESELRIDVWRQAIRVTHIATGLTAEATGEGESRMREVALTAVQAALTANAKLSEI